MSCSNKPVNDTNFFNWRSSEYDGDKALFGSGVSEIINSFGVLSGYYIVDVSVENNKLFGEDNDRNLIRKFPLMVQFELPEENRTSGSGMGIIDTDIFKVRVGINSMAVNSSKGGFEERLPQEGDLIKPKFNSIWYEIIDVRNSENQFLQTQHVWSLTVRTYRDNKISATPEVLIAIPEASDIIDRSDIYNQSTDIDNVKPDIIIEPTFDSPDSQFGNW